MVRTKNQSSSSSASSSTKSPAKISIGGGGGGGGGGGSGNNRSRSCSDALIDDGKSSSKLSSNRQRSSGTTTTTIASTPGSSPDDDTTDADLTPTSGNAPRSSNSVHKQNLYVVSFPIIFLFNVLRSLIYQLFCIFRYLYGASTKVIYRSPHRRDCNIEIVVQNSKDQHQQALIHPLERGEDGSLIESQRAQHILPQRRLQALEMSGNRAGGAAGGGGASGGYSPGPGDPLLAKQKHHHRRAFEYISKALKIDEENEGKYSRSTMTKERGIKRGVDGGLHWFRLRFHCVAAAGVVLHESSHAVARFVVCRVCCLRIDSFTHTHSHTHTLRAQTYTDKTTFIAYTL